MLTSVRTMNPCAMKLSREYSTEQLNIYVTLTDKGVIAFTDDMPQPHIIVYKKDFKINAFKAVLHSLIAAPDDSVFWKGRNEYMPFSVLDVQEEEATETIEYAKTFIQNMNVFAEIEDSVEE